MIGETVLHYKILEKLGEGGMGEVFKAQDTKLDRFVALKFLPSQITASEDDKSRFVQEAKAASAMNHPNVCTIYDIQDLDGQLFIVMEYVDGKTLKDKKESLSEKQILEIGIQTAEGLAAAHEKGIVHRDIKPENIMIRKDGIVQIMDFGLAKLYKDGNVSRLTKAGITMGTMGYMSPEQIQGFDVDHRTDIFSLGVVLYELLSGESPFKAVHETAMLYEIVNVNPVPISTVKEGIDLEIDEIVLECLEKDKDERYQSARELAKDLRRVKKSTGHSKSRVYKVAGNPAVSKSGMQTVNSASSAAIEIFNRRFEFKQVLPALFILAALAAVFFAYKYFEKNDSPSGSTVQFQIYPPSGLKMVNSMPRISPDGNMVAYVASDSSGRTMLWVRPIGSVKARPLEGTEDAGHPFWSYDGKYLGFFADGKLLKLNLLTGLKKVICDASSGWRGVWGSDNQIIFIPEFFAPVYKVNSDGGTVSQVTFLDNTLGEENHLPMQFMPDNEHFIYSSMSRNEGQSYLYVGSINDKTRKQIIKGDNITALFMEPDYLLYNLNTTLYIQKFDPDTYELHGEPRILLNDVSDFDACSDLLLATNSSGGSQSNVGFYDRTGKLLNKVNDLGLMVEISLSPDQKRFAYHRVSGVDEDFTNQDIWIYDMQRKFSSRFTSTPAAEMSPVWSPDGNKIVYSSSPDSVYNVYEKDLETSSKPKLMFRNNFTVKAPVDWSSDGKFILMGVLPSVTGKGDIWVLPASGDEKPYPYLNTEFNETPGGFSPDGKKVLYASDETGRSEVYIQSFPVPSEKIVVSTGGGRWPDWSRNGREIYYLSSDDFLTAVSYKPGSPPELGSPEKLFKLKGIRFLNMYKEIDDGRRFIINTISSDYKMTSLLAVLNWKSMLEENKN